MTAIEIRESLEALRKQKETVKKEYDGAMKYLDEMIDNIKGACPHKYEDGKSAVDTSATMCCLICDKCFY